jgi:hypothetical protein
MCTSVQSPSPLKRGAGASQNDLRLGTEWFAQPAKMVCATCENGLRSWQNGLRLISKLTDVLGKMICALICAWFALDLRLVCAKWLGVPVAQRKSFSKAMSLINTSPVRR